ncbi:MAG: hypothetical protein VYE68_13490 [Acidobacteriota bacterium]|nr:hypothetical protein [Acidobacteriota bacterium]
MTFDVEVLLKGTDEVVTENVAHDGPEPSGWTDVDVREVLLSTLRVFARVNSKDGPSTGEVSLRGLSWIVTEVEAGVVIAIEIPSGAIAAGPFAVPADELTQMIARVISSSAQTGQVH